MKKFLEKIKWWDGWNIVINAKKITGTGSIISNWWTWIIWWKWWKINILTENMSWWLKIIANWWKSKIKILLLLVLIIFIIMLVLIEFWYLDNFKEFF